MRSHGPKYAIAKCILIVNQRLTKAIHVFKGTAVDVKVEGAKDSGIEINTTGTRHLGAAVGTEKFKAEYVNTKIDGWILALKKLSAIATSQPHAAFSAFTQCMQSQWTFLSRSMPEISPLLARLEDVIRLCFLPALLRRPVNDFEREVLSLPARMGGLGISLPHINCISAHANSLKVSAPLIRLIARQELDLDPRELATQVKHLRAQIDESADKDQALKLQQLIERADDGMKFALKVSAEKGASSWVTATPLYDHGTVLHKGDFVDAVYMRYGWTLPDLPVRCGCQQAAFSLQHALDCKTGGYRTIQHNEVRDVCSLARALSTRQPTRKMMREVTSKSMGFGGRCDRRFSM